MSGLTAQQASDRTRRSLGMSLWALWALAALGVPRVVAHDLDLVGPLANSVLVFLPLAIWLAVALWRRVPHPFRTLLVVGLFYGALVAVTHQVLWTHSFDGDPPALGGNLRDTLPPTWEAVVLRAFAFASSLFTGAFVGAIVGALGLALARVVPGFRPGVDQPRTRLSQLTGRD